MSYDAHPALNEESNLTNKKAPYGTFRVIGIYLPNLKEYWISDRNRFTDALRDADMNADNLNVAHIYNSDGKLIHKEEGF